MENRKRPLRMIIRVDEQEKEMFGLQDQILGALSIEREEA